MAERGLRSRWALRSRGTALLAVGAVGAIVVGLVWTAGGNGAASGRAGGAADAGIAAGSQARGAPVRWDGARLARGAPKRLTLYFTGKAPGPPEEPCTGTYEATATASAAPR
jgi:hypothetical protein